MDRIFRDPFLRRLAVISDFKMWRVGFKTEIKETIAEEKN